MLKRDFGVDLPISGGTGNSLENAVVIEPHNPPDCVAVEYLYLKYIGLGRMIKWNTIGQEPITSGEKGFDKITIEIIQDGQATHNENYYFDISHFL